MAAAGRRPSAAVLLACIALAGCGGGGHSRRQATSPTVARAAAAPATTTAPRTEPAQATPPAAAATAATTTTAPVATDAAALGAALAQSEEAVRRDDLSAAERARYGQILALGYRLLAAHPDWVPAVLAVAPPNVKPAVDRNARAAIQLRALSHPKTAIPPWHIVEPRPAASLLAYYHEAENATGVPWAVLAAVHMTETNMGRIRGDSTAGAQGPMQFLPATWSAYGRGDIHDDHDAIQAAARYLKANGAPGDLRSALRHYNHSDHYVNAVLLLAEEMNSDPRAYASYYFRPVVYSLVTGDVVLPVTG